jgi:hypothetical protein
MDKLTFRERDDLRILAAILYRYAQDPIPGIRVDLVREHEYSWDEEHIMLRICIPRNLLVKTPTGFIDFTDEDGLVEFVKEISK